MYNNKLLNSCAGEQPQFLRNRLKPIEFVHGDLIIEAGTPVRHVIFPRSGLISMVLQLSDGERIEVGMVGADGAIGGSVVFGAAPSICTSVVQVPSRAWAMTRADATEVATENPRFRRLLYLEERWTQAQAQQIAACNAKHPLAQRLCSWLLRANDALGGSELLITQEHLAHALGVQRASISLVASRLQDQRIVEYRRGRVRILDSDRLAEHACECHAALLQTRELVFEREAPALTVQSGDARVGELAAHCGAS
jgi:CRP-like cAMP-binding protein